jgi:hypothetical protein
MRAIIDNIESISPVMCIIVKDRPKVDIEILVSMNDFLKFLIETLLTVSFCFKFSRYSVRDREIAEE